MLLELVRPDVAQEITGRITIPTIGIGAGPHCDGQVLVTHDLVGAFPWFTPRHVKPKADVAGQFKAATEAWVRDVKAASRTVS